MECLQNGLQPKWYIGRRLGQAEFFQYRIQEEGLGRLQTEDWGQKTSWVNIKDSERTMTLAQVRNLQDLIRSDTE